MTISKLSNIPLKDFRRFLKSQGLILDKNSKGRGGHEKWTNNELLRPITIQSHIDPVPEFIVKQILRYLNMDREIFIEQMNKL
ncbi:MAG: type II toxin-antitoxin system HicA family toxin [Saprospiraceae bacterium]|jgi:hypothetical protein|uniref:hypothetical protein n=1 Tax=Candidatus Brachybacter algidus TaxID=2982024 RepID=UPI001B753A50|nr:hypothetical protein [Candidatus Brachybacter algidus]MBP7305376.1 hypothetical protein [Saprospiraceae bacterium]MBK6372275.1 type II toxin-antitoxin system HicA family toxin [Candidatus Brachybacter algidus]MBK6447478.1 type II toxin-antitoxin system HicA family toxin [Candidatus Brachybacter algidus]MBK7603314.1 type II toxin-antitoxin system HicA family toxin [Candidatus Brachybacter algidus]MBK8356720.1 type II toxin-antitoxin system HicA family toxin [Candidatus Brachybacter algidus]